MNAPFWESDYAVLRCTKCDCFLLRFLVGALEIYDINILDIMIILFNLLKLNS